MSKTQKTAEGASSCDRFAPEALISPKREKLRERHSNPGALISPQREKTGKEASRSYDQSSPEVSKSSEHEKPPEEAP